MWAALSSSQCHTCPLYGPKYHSSLREGDGTLTHGRWQHMLKEVRKWKTSKRKLRRWLRKKTGKNEGPLSYVVLQSHPVGETAACSGYITETTQMIKYVWNLEFIAMTALLWAIGIHPKSHTDARQNIFKKQTAYKKHVWFQLVLVIKSKTALLVWIPIILQLIYTLD